MNEFAFGRRAQPPPFRDRRDAGRQLAARLSASVELTNPLVLALPRGGVPVGYEVALELDAPLDVFLVRKLGLPGHEELAMGAIALGGGEAAPHGGAEADAGVRRGRDVVRVLNPDVVDAFGIPEKVIDAVAAGEQAELRRRERAYRGDRPAPDVRGRDAVLVDDGLATGSTMRAAALALRRMEPARVVVAVPVSSRETCDEFRTEVDHIVCAITPEPMRAVGLWYEDFSQTTDDEVRELLDLAARRGRDRRAA